MTLDTGPISGPHESSELSEKMKKLRAILSGLESVLVAYSGGVDSSFLLKVAYDTLGDKAIGVTATSDTMPLVELKHARALAKEMGVEHVIVETDEMCDPNFLANEPDRCFHCKRLLFTKLRELAVECGAKHVIEGSNLSDRSDYRPGKKAVDMLSVRSPLAEAGLTKDDIRTLSRQAGMSTWDRAAAPCLSSRIPYGSEITLEKLHRIEQSERFLRELGFKVVRVRDHGDVARVEIPVEELSRLMSDDLRGKVTQKLKSFGYNWVAVDMDGFRSGSLNEALRDRDDG